MAVPFLLYQFNPTEERLKKLWIPFTTCDSNWADYIGDVFTLFKPDLLIPPLMSDKELQEKKVPTLVFAGENDISLPGKQMVQADIITKF